eukprot:gene5339-5725_t
MFELCANFFLLLLACFFFFPQAKCLETYVTPQVSPLFGKSLVHNGKSIVPCRIFRPDRKTGNAFLQFLYATYEVIPSFNRSTNVSQLNFVGVGLTNQMDQSSTRIHVSLSTKEKEIYRLSVPYKTTSNYTEATSLGKFRWFTSPESRIFEVKVSFPLQDLYLPKYDKNKVLPAGVYDVEVYVRNTKKDEERSCIRIHRAFTVYPVKIPVKLSLMSPLIGNPLIAGNLTVVNGSISSPFQSWDRVYVDISNNGKNMTFLPRITANDSIPFDYLAENVTLSLTLRRVGSFYPAVPASETILHLLDQQSDGCNNIHSVNLTFISQTVTVAYQNSCYVLCDLNQRFAFNVYPNCDVPFSLPPWNQQIQGPNVDANGCYAQSYPDISRQVRYLLSGPYSRVRRIFPSLPTPIRKEFEIHELEDVVDSLFNYQLERREVEVVNNAIVFQYSDSCDISDWTSITCVCYFQDNNNGEIDIFYRLAPTLPTIRKTFRVYLQYLPTQEPSSNPLIFKSHRVNKS